MNRRRSLFWPVGCVLMAASFACAQEEKPSASRDSLQRVGVGDSVLVNVLEENSISGVFKVGANGEISYPMFGKIKVEGLTLDEVAQQIEEGLEKDYIRDAIVSVTLTERKGNSVFIFGGVRGQGQQTFDPSTGITLGRAIAKAGGFDEAADKDKIELQRSSGDKLESFDLTFDKYQDTPLEDGDVVVVQIKPEMRSALAGGGGAGAVAVPTGRVIVMGQVNRAGIVEVPLEGGADILEVISMAGGFTRLARPAKTRIQRNNENGESATMTIDVDDMMKAKGSQRFQVLPGDTIFVPETIF